MATLTAKGAATRRRIVDGAAAAIRDGGAGATTLEDIMARTSTSKSQLFHYFPEGKEQLLLAVAQHEAQRVLSDQEPHLSQLTSWRAWRDWRDAVVDRYRTQGQDCPMSAIVSEVGRSTPGARAITTELMAQWQARIAVGIRAMQRSGKIRPGLDADRHASALLAGIQGGVLIMLSTGSLSALESALDINIVSLRS